MKFLLPQRLTYLIEIGWWPSTDGPSMTEQELNPLISAEKVQRFASDESRICLQPPPFFTIAQEQLETNTSDFWEQFGSLEQIVPERALVIGDFGLGSDSPIILAFARRAANPPVLRLRWGRGQANQWVQAAKDFDEFAALLDLPKNS